MKDFSKGLIEKEIAKEMAVPNKVYAEYSAKYMKLYWGKMYTEAEVLEEVKKLLQEGFSTVYLRVPTDKMFDDGEVDSRLIIKRSFPIDGETILGYLIEGARTADQLKGFYFGYNIVSELAHTIYGLSEKSENLVEFSNFSSTKEVRDFILDNREEYEGYIVRSNNGWDSDTIYRWQELANGKVIWRKEKV